MGYGRSGIVRFASSPKYDLHNSETNFEKIGVCDGCCSRMLAGLMSRYPLRQPRGFLVRSKIDCLRLPVQWNREQSDSKNATVGIPQVGPGRSEKFYQSR